jgi:hypothetical protein
MDVEACQKHAGTLGLWLQRRIVDDVECQQLCWTDYAPRDSLPGTV